MKLSRSLQSTFRTTIACNKQRLQARHPAKSISYTTRSLIISTTTTQSQRLQIQPSPPLSKISASARLPYSSSANSPSSHPPSPSPTMDTPESTRGNTNNDPQPESQPPSNSSPLPALPAADGAPTTLEVGGAALRLDHLGPLVVNEDGTLSRIANWEKMADIERENTLRILGKRNKMRLAKLRAAKESGNSENVSEIGTDNK
ncbi:hypothetical protein F4859DRAFT_224564 [Xylaria cf. heliscus]|nr:hypothetical protein F4859DRAFT_224564 [Xylaria cf. heliscus]